MDAKERGCACCASSPVYTGDALSLLDDVAVKELEEIVVGHSARLARQVGLVVVVLGKADIVDAHSGGCPIPGPTLKMT